MIILRTIYLALTASFFILLAGCQDSLENINREFADNRASSYYAISTTQSRAFNSLGKPVVTPANVAEKDILRDVSSGDYVINGTLTIDDCIELALRHSPAIQDAKIRVLDARANSDQAVSTALPTVNLSAFWYKNDNSGLMVQKETRDISLLARQPLYLGGVVGAALDASKAYSIQVAHELRAAVQDLQLEVRTAFLDLLLAHETALVARDSLENARKLLDDTETKQKYGTALKYELLRAQVHVNEEIASEIQARSNLRIAQVKLLSIIGVSRPVRLK